MKKIMLALLLASNAWGVNTIQSYTPTESRSQGCLGTAMGTVTYALNNDLTGTTSSVIDLGSFLGVFVTVTNTAGTGAAQVDVLWSNTPTAATFAATAYTIGGPGSECLPKKARYVKFRNNPAALPTNKVSLFYDPLTTTPVTATINQTITVTGAVGVTSTPFASWQIVSQTTRTISSPTSINISSVAGSTGIFQYRFQASNSASSGVYWNETANSTWVPPRAFYSVTTTPIQASNIFSGTHLNMSPASATDISATVEVIIKKLNMIVP